MAGLSSFEHRYQDQSILGAGGEHGLQGFPGALLDVVARVRTKKEEWLALSVPCYIDGAYQ